MGIIESAGRVTVLPSAAVPGDLRLQLAGFAQTLRKSLLPNLDRELRHRYPLVVIYPSCWSSTLEDRTGGFAHGAVGPFETERGAVLAVHLPAASVLAFPTPIIEGILAHEYLHYVWHTCQIATHHEVASGLCGSMAFREIDWLDGSRGNVWQS